MTAIGICGIAFNSSNERYDSFHTPPEVKDFIKSVAPAAAGKGYQEGGKWYKVDTTEGGCRVTAADSVLVPRRERRPFSYWLLQPYPPGAVICWRHQTLDLFKGEFGIVGLYFGIGRPPIRWEGFEERAFDRFAAIMIANFPSWQPPQPDPPR